MKIAVVQGLPPGGARFAAGQLTARLAATDEVTEFEVTFGAGAPEPSMFATRGRAVNLPAFGRSKSDALRNGTILPIRWVASLRRLAHEIDAGGFDVVLAHPFVHTQACPVIGMLRTPTVYFAQEVRRRSFERRYAGWTGNTGLRRVVGKSRFLLEDWWARPVDRWAVSRAGEVVVSSVYVYEDFYRAYGRYPVIAPLGVDEQFHDMDESIERAHLLVVGGLEPLKAPDLVIEAVGLLPIDDRPPVVIVGQRVDPAYAGLLERQARRLGVRLNVQPDVSAGDLRTLYQGAIATCAVSHLEPFGLSVLESLACGTPVIAVREGGYRETVAHEVTGLLVERRPHDLARAISEVRARPWSAHRLREAVVPYYTWTAAAQRLRNVLQDCTGAT